MDHSPEHAPVPLGALRRGDAAWAGGKGARLGDLMAAGFPVPVGFVIPVGSATASAAGAADPAGSIRRAYRGLGPDVAVAVRSSSPGEDGEGDSRAGRYETVLDVVGVGPLLDAVATVWGSARDDTEDDPMAVLVQRMVPADVAGVVFSRDPDRPELVVIESAPGLGTGVVDGAVDPERHRLSRVRRAGVESEPGAGTTACLLDDDAVRAVADLAVSTEAHFGAPQDVEWAIAAGRLHLLQSRPLVTGPPTSSSDATTTRVILRGHGVGGGQATGAVRRLDQPIDAAGIAPGEVLVTAATTPAWLPLLRVAGAVVTDLGGVTSHAAIVCRELGVPAVVGAASATTTLVDGQRVHVDASRGEVRAATG